ncbi:MAG: DUF4167 domain-containing protein [Inquilinus sp.]|nr:DUF4167 domain-containing protein [Inquilinus sp.]
MRQGPSNRRARGRGNTNSGRRGNLPNRNQTFDSNGPDVRIRGTAIQVNDKYQALARDASTSGDRVMAENYLQHAEHYHRIILAMNEAHTQQQQQQPPQHEQGGRDNGHRQPQQRDGGHRERGQQYGDGMPGDPREGVRQIEVDFGADPRQEDARESAASTPEAVPNGAAETDGPTKVEAAVDGAAVEAAPSPASKPNGADEGAAATPPRRRRGPGRPRKQPTETTGEVSTDGD